MALGAAEVASALCYGEININHMPKQPRISAYSDRWQCMFLLLFALREMGMPVAKGEALDLISKRAWFALQDKYQEPYASTRVRGSKEPRWRTMLAFARKDCVERGHMLNTKIRDWWEITAKGQAACDQLIGLLRRNELNIERCDLWDITFRDHLRDQIA